MFENLLSEFTSSKQAQDATAALASKGYSPLDAEKIIAEALPAANAQFRKQAAYTAASATFSASEADMSLSNTGSMEVLSRRQSAVATPFHAFLSVE